MKCFALQKVIFSQESFKLSVHIQLSYMVMIFCFVSIYIYIKINAFCGQGHLIKLVIGVHYLKKKKKTENAENVEFENILKATITDSIFNNEYAYATYTIKIVSRHCTSFSNSGCQVLCLYKSIFQLLCKNIIEV